MFQIRETQAGADVMGSQYLVVSSAVTAPEFEPNSKPFTSTPVMMRTPSASALSANP
jgi:hypothetical protein